MMQPALACLANCVHAPPALAHLIAPTERPAPRKKQARAALQTPGQALDTAAKAPEAELGQASSLEVSPICIVVCVCIQSAA